MKILHIVTMLSTALMVVACAEPAPRLEKEFGEATRTTLHAQIINPDAGNNPNPVAGIDGLAGRDAVNSYQRSFGRPVQNDNIFNINVGGKK